MLTRLSAETGVEVAVRAAAAHGHDPTWDSRTDTLLWTDRPSRSVHRFRPRGSDHVMEVPQPVSGAKPRSRGGLVLHLADGIALYAGDGEERTWLAYWAREGSRGEATAIDALRRLWASTLTNGGNAGDQLVRVDPNAQRRIATVSSQAVHGLAWSPDDAALYRLIAEYASIEYAGTEHTSVGQTSSEYSDPQRGDPRHATARHGAAWHGGGPEGSSRHGITISRFDLATGSVTEQQPLCAVESSGTPRGLCVDADGGLWITVDGDGEIRRYTPEGGLDVSIALPARRPTGCCFGGPELTDLYVTSAREGLEAPSDADGALLVLPGVGNGLRSTAFAG